MSRRSSKPWMNAPALRPGASPFAASSPTKLRPEDRENTVTLQLTAPHSMQLTVCTSLYVSHSMRLFVVVYKVEMLYIALEVME